MSKLQRTKIEWAELLTRQKASGQGVKDWCAANGINTNSMYNKIAQNRKEQANQNTNSKRKRSSRTNETGTDKAVRNEAKPVTVEWKEVEVTSEQQSDGIQRCSVYVEIGGMRFAADAGYPVRKLAELCKELLRTC